jgi:putative glycosyltransferase (TIGR04372 family)
VGHYSLSTTYQQKTQSILRKSVIQMRLVCRLINKVQRLLYLVLALVGVLIIYVIYPLIKVRLGKLRVERIGHLVFEPELYLGQMHQQNGNKWVDLFFYDRGQNICNEQVLNMWKRVICIVPFKSVFNEIYNLLDRKVPGGKNRLIKWQPHNRTELFNYSPHISLKQSELVKSELIIREMGVSGEYVCFHSRDSEYLNRVSPNESWTHHDYRDADIDNYLLAAKGLCDEGLTAIRMGSVVKKQIDTSNPKIIDYASSNFQCDLMDVYLSIMCKFFIVSNTGMIAIAKVFHRPMAVPNMIPINSIQYFSEKDVFIPKLIVSNETNRFLSFTEMFKYNGADITSRIQKNKFILIENCPEDIADLAIELNMKLNGEWRESLGGKERQEKFREITMKHYPDIHHCKIGSKFLKKYQYLLNEEY